MYFYLSIIYEFLLLFNRIQITYPSPIDQEGKLFLLCQLYCMIIKECTSHVNFGFIVNENLIAFKLLFYEREF